MRCRACRKEVSPKTSINISHLDSKDTVRLCDGCFQGEGREVVKERFGSVMERYGKPTKVHYDIHGQNERAKESRQRGIDKSREIRRVS